MLNSVTQADFNEQVLQNDQVVLVDFWAPWCGPCQAMMPALEAAAKTFDGRAQVVKVNIEEDGELAAEYGVMSIPTLKVFKGGQVVEEAIGGQSESALVDLVQNHL